MSRIHGRGTAQNFPDFALNLEICISKPNCFFTSVFYVFYSFCFMIHTYCVIFGVIFSLFFAQNYKIKVMTVQKKSIFFLISD